MESLIRSFRLSLRRLIQEPGFTFIVVFVLALGIGASTALWSVVDGVLFRPLPYPESERLVMLLRNERGEEYAAHSPADFLDFREQSRSFERLSALGSQSLTLSGDGEPERVRGASVSADFFTTLGAQVVRGRTFDPSAESWSQEARAVVVSYDLWQRRLGGAEDVVGRTLRLDDEPYTILGVMGRGFDFPQDAELWRRSERDIPAMPGGRPLPNDPAMLRGMVYFPILGRLAPDTTLEEAQAEIEGIAAGLAEEYPNFYDQTSFRLVPLQDHLLGDVGDDLFLLLGAVALVLLIACANVANLLLARGTTRRQEIAIRGALGASRNDLLTLELVESLVLAFLGGGLGFLFAHLALESTLTLAPGILPRLDEVALDRRVLAFTLAVSSATGLLFGLLPALQAARVSPQDVLREAGRSGGPRQRWRRALVCVEMALALILLIGAGLMFKSLHQIRSVDPGFRPEGLLTVNVNLPSHRYPDPAQQVSFYDRILERLNALPGAQRAAMALAPPMSGTQVGLNFLIEGRPQTEAEQDDQVVDFNSVSAHYFETLGIPIRRGRGFNALDRETSEPVAVLSESLVRRYFADQDPLGQRVGLPSPGGEVAWKTVVGVVGDVHQSDLEATPSPTLYIPYPQGSWPFATIAVQTVGEPLLLARAAREAVFEVDPNQAVFNVGTMEQRLAETLAEKRFLLVLLALFAGLALTLAAVGVYGLMAWTVAQRVREIGIRVALGAEGQEVLTMVVRDTLRLVSLGLVAGFVGALALTRFLGAHLYEVSPTDPSTFGALGLILTMAAITASYIPARRASRIDPIHALRHG